MIFAEIVLPITAPVEVFSIILLLMLLVPLGFRRLNLPPLIGFILAGVLLGPYGLGVLRRDSSIVLFGTVGLLYIMFQSAIEIDLSDLRKRTLRVITFGLAAFAIPFVLGTYACMYILGFNTMSSILLAGMFSTYTLVAYPIVMERGLGQLPVVTVVVGGTLITDVLALLTLAYVTNSVANVGSTSVWWTLSLSVVGFLTVVLGIVPLVVRWYFRTVSELVPQFLFSLVIVFACGMLAQLAGLEPIIGAFFGGLTLNSHITHDSALHRRMSFVGEAIFIPFFLISVGMLVDLSVLTKGWRALEVAGVILLLSFATKYIVSQLMRLLFRISRTEARMMFGLSSAHAAATLAIVLVGYNIITGETPSGEPIRLLNDNVLNGTIILILISCSVSSIIVDQASRVLRSK